MCVVENRPVSQNPNEQEKAENIKSVTRHYQRSEAVSCHREDEKKLSLEAGPDCIPVLEDLGLGDIVGHAGVDFLHLLELC